MPLTLAIPDDAAHRPLTLNLALSGDPVLSRFTLDLAPLWNPDW